MITRRDFLETSLGGALAAGGALIAGRTFIPSAAALVQPRFGVVDLQLQESSAYRVRLAQRGIAELVFAGDVTEVWFRTLDPLWREQQAAVAGLTRHSTLFGLERLAWDHRLRLVQRLQLAPDCFAWLIALPARRSLP